MRDLVRRVTAALRGPAGVGVVIGLVLTASGALAIVRHDRALLAPSSPSGGLVADSEPPAGAEAPTGTAAPVTTPTDLPSTTPTPPPPDRVLRANGHSTQPSLSRDGTLLAFTSEATNLVPGDTNGVADVFVRDMRDGSIRRASVDARGQQADGPSGAPAISGDGRTVAFASSARTLGSDGARWIVLVKDLSTGAVERVEVAHDGSEPDALAGAPVPHRRAIAISGDGTRVAFVSPASNLVPGDTNGVADVFLRDRASRTTQVVSVASDGSPADGESLDVALSGDGTVAAFTSFAALVPEDTNHHPYADVFARELGAGTTELLSVDRDGTQPQGYASSPSISHDGRFVTFRTSQQLAGAGDAMYAYIRDRTAGTLEPLEPREEWGGVSITAIAPGGDVVAWGSAVLSWVQARFRSEEPPPFLSTDGLNGLAAADDGSVAFDIVGEVTPDTEQPDKISDIFVLDARTGKPRLASVPGPTT